MSNTRSEAFDFPKKGRGMKLRRYVQTQSTTTQRGVYIFKRLWGKERKPLFLASSSRSLASGRPSNLSPLGGSAASTFPPAAVVVASAASDATGAVASKDSRTSLRKRISFRLFPRVRRRSCEAKFRLIGLKMVEGEEGRGVHKAPLRLEDYCRLGGSAGQSLTVQTQEDQSPLAP